MKVIKAIFTMIKAVFILILILFLILVILLTGIGIRNTIIYKMYDETCVMKNGNLCISHICDGPVCHGEYYNSDNNVLQEVKRFAKPKGLKLGSSGFTDDAFGIVYKPVNSGTSDVYVGYVPDDTGPLRYFELYHVEVDKDLNITYTMETISKEEFEENTMQ
ncbi:MAG: hypothetical protein NC177_09280 [Ruminococcus flavefaciens]|nr:hypothetical protein [Ruminococcus flavefaciens]